MESSNYDCPKKNCRPHILNCQELVQSVECQDLKTCGENFKVQEDSYDIPRPSKFNYFESRKDLPPSIFDSIISKPSWANILNYDIPRNNSYAETQFSAKSTHQYQKVSKQLDDNNIAYSQESQRSLLPVVSNSFKEVNLESNLSIKTLSKLEIDTTEAISRALCFISPNCHLTEDVESVHKNIILSLNCLRNALRNLTNFVERVYGNAMIFEDHYILSKMHPYITALRHAFALINSFSERLNFQEKQILENTERRTINEFISQENIDELITCIKSLIENIQKLSTFIQKNSALLFEYDSAEKKYNELKSSKGNINCITDFNYLYGNAKFVSNSPLFHRFDAAKNDFNVNAKAMSNEMMQVFNRNDLKSKDKVLIRYYAVRTSTLMGNLRQAIDSFLETVESNQPPKVFIAYAKLVIISVYNLITMSDMIYRQISKLKFHERMSDCISILLDTLKIFVCKSKMAAVYFPSIIVVQEMVDSVVDVSLLATDLKTIMLQAVYLKCL